LRLGQAGPGASKEKRELRTAEDDPVQGQG
jgi:hypothetical protein